MAKKKSAYGGKLFNICAVVLGIVAICMMFLTSVKVVSKLGSLTDTTTFKGTEVTFGLEYFTKFSFLNLLPYILVLVGVVCSIVSIVAKKNTKTYDLVSAIAFVVAGALFFVTVGFTQWESTYKTALDFAVKAGTTTVSLGIGAIIAAVVSLASGVVVLIKTCLKK